MQNVSPNVELKDNSLLMRGREVAEALGVSRALAYKMMAAGILPTVRVPGGRTVRVPRASLLEWIRSQTQQPAGRTAA